MTWPAAYARLAMVQGGRDARAPALGPTKGRLGPMVYVAAKPPERLAALATESGPGLVVLVVPDQTLVGGRPQGIRGPMLPTLDVSGCRGFLLGVRHEPERPKAKETAPA